MQVKGDEMAVPEFINTFYTPKGDDFEKMVSVLDERGVLKYLQALVEPGQWSPHAHMLDGKWMDGSKLVAVLSNFENTWNTLAGSDRRKRFGQMIVPPWKYNEIMQVAHSFNYPMTLSLPYLSELYTTMNWSEDVRKALEYYERFEEEAGEREALRCIAQTMRRPEDITLGVIDALENDAHVCLLGLANRLAGLETYNVEPHVCGTVLTQLRGQPNAVDNLNILNAPDAYLVAAAGDKACGHYIGKLAKDSMCMREHEEFGKVVKNYSESANPDLELVRANIREITY